MVDANLPFLIGPIKTGDPFLISTFNNKTSPFQLQILCVVAKDQQVVYQWQFADDILTQGITGVGVFTVSGTTESMTFTDTANGGGLAMDGSTLINSFRLDSFKMVQTSYQPWNPPDVLLSRVYYSLLTSDGSTIVIPGDDFPTNTNNILCLAITWYVNLGGCVAINNPVDTMLEWECVASPGNQSCNGVQISPGGWTDPDDCQSQAVYTYCLKGTNCGNTKCKGPCTNHQLCKYNSNNQDFVCGFNPSEWWRSQAFIYGMIGVGVFILLLVIGFIAFIVYERRKENKRLLEQREEFELQDVTSGEFGDMPSGDSFDESESGIIPAVYSFS